MRFASPAVIGNAANSASISGTALTPRPPNFAEQPAASTSSGPAGTPCASPRPDADTSNWLTLRDWLTPVSRVARVSEPPLPAPPPRSHAKGGEKHAPGERDASSSTSYTAPGRSRVRLLAGGMGKGWVTRLPPAGVRRIASTPAAGRLVHGRPLRKGNAIAAISRACLLRSTRYDAFCPAPRPSAGPELA